LRQGKSPNPPESFFIDQIGKQEETTLIICIKENFILDGGFGNCQKH